MSAVVEGSVGSAGLNRREFLSRMGAALGGLVLIGGLPGVIKAEDAKEYGADSMPRGWTDNPLVFVAIGADGTVTMPLVGDMLVTLQEELSNWDTSGSVDPATLKKVFMAAVDQLSDEDFAGAGADAGAA